MAMQQKRYYELEFLFLLVYIDSSLFYLFFNANFQIKDNYHYCG